MESTNQQLCEDMVQFMQHLKGAFFGLAESLDLTPAQLSTLYWVHKEGEIAMGQIASVLHCDASNVTGLVDRLIAHNLVVRQESSRDRRIKTLRLTVRGKEVTEELLEKIPSAVNCHRLSATQRQQLRELLRVISS